MSLYERLFEASIDAEDEGQTDHALAADKADFSLCAIL